MSFKGVVAVVTGAASGIGKAIAEKCIQKEMCVVLADIRKDELEAVKTNLEKNAKAQVLAIVTDVSKEDSIINLAEKSTNEFGKVNFLFNNAGIAGPLGPIWEQATESIEKVIDVNLLGTLYGIKAFVPIMLKQNDECYIINTSAGAGLLTGKGLSAYKTSKHGITALSEVLDADLKSINAKINVSILIPHWVNTEMPHSILNTDVYEINKHVKHLQEFGISPDEVADIVFEGIKNKQLYIFTHPNEHLPLIRKRLELFDSICAHLINNRN